MLKAFLCCAFYECLTSLGLAGVLSFPDLKRALSESVCIHVLLSPNCLRKPWHMCQGLP